MKEKEKIKIKTLKTSAAEFVGDMVYGRFRQFPKKKFGKKLYHDDLLSAYYSGSLTIYDAIKKLTDELSELTDSEKLGEIHVLCQEIFNDFAQNYSNSRVPKREIEEFI